MDERRKPPLGEDVYEEISLAQHKVHKAYWAKLSPLLVSPVTRWVTVAKGEPPPPALPKRLGRILREYACAIFDVEASYYPASAELQTWLENLAENVAEKVEERILDRSLPDPFGGTRVFQGALTYHATEEQMRKTIREALKLRVACDKSPVLDSIARRTPSAALAKGGPCREVPFESKTPNAENGTPQKSPLAVDARTVASGVAQVSLADLNIPVNTSLKEVRGVLLKLGAPARKLRDRRILEAADYKIENPKCTYKELSIKFFGTPKRADSIRSWVNRRKSRDGRG